jgi:hypothetical protein
MLSQRVHYAHVFAAFVLTCLAGCARPTADVSGTIKIEEKPPKLEGLKIAFVAEDGTVVLAPINLDGTYTAKNVPAGEQSIGFMGGLPKGQPKARRPSPDDDGKPDPTKVNLDHYPIPKYLRAPSTSDLKFTVEAGKVNTFDYDISP